LTQLDFIAALAQAWGWFPAKHGDRIKLLHTVFLFILLLGSGSLGAQTFSEFGPAVTPLAIAPGPDGNVWFTEYSRFGNSIGRITPAGQITKFPIPTDESIPAAITTGPDGAMWFTEGRGNQIGRITTSGVFTEFPVPGPFIQLTGIAAGSDGNLWFTGGESIWRITTTGAVTSFPLPTPGTEAGEITRGPDGNLWFTEGRNVGRITTSGAITEFAAPSSDPLGITAGPDGAVWFTEPGANKIGRITSSGAIIEFSVPTPASGLRDIVAGLDGNLYFAEWTGNKIGRITTAGVATEFPIPTIGSNPYGIASGPDGAIWFTEWTGGKIGRLSIPFVPLECESSGTTLCLNNGRFRVTADWRTVTDSGTATAVLLANDSGYFWFFDVNNVEIIVKALNGCGVNSRYWVFAAGLTDVEVTLRVTDTQTGAARTYLNPRGSPYQPVQDTSAFATCP
jgi:virginiamycin B lyase